MYEVHKVRIVVKIILVFLKKYQLKNLLESFYLLLLCVPSRIKLPLLEMFVMQSTIVLWLL